MSEPNYYWISETIRKWSLVIAGVFLFVLYGCDLNTARTLIAQVDSRVKAQTELLEVQIKSANAALVKIQLEKEQADTKLAQHRLAISETPTIRVRPIVKSLGSHKGVRDVSLDAQILNEGEVPVQVKNVNVKVSKGELRFKASDVVRRTQRLWELEPYAFQPRIKQADGTIAPQTADQQEYTELHVECPHGQMFSLDTASTDLLWTEVSDLSISRPIEAELYPGGSISQLFPFVLTENLYHNMGWYKMELTVDLAHHPAQTFSIFIPTGREVDPGASYRVAKTAYAERTGASPLDGEPVQWTTQSPLPPMSKPAGDAK